MPSNDFGSIRSALAMTPDEHAWSLLCEALDGWDDEAFVVEARAYVLEALEGWPVELRVAPGSWCELAKGKVIPPRFELAHFFPVDEVSSEMLERWAESPAMKNVRELELGSVSADAVIAMARSEVFRNIRRINLENNSVELDAFRELTRAKHLSTLEWLNVGWTGLADDSAGNFAGEAEWPNLEYLHIEGNGIYEDGGVALVTSPHLVSLERLRLGWNDIGDATCHALAKRAVFTPQLLELGLENNSITADGGLAIASCRRFGPIEEIDLYNNDFTAEVAIALARNPTLSHMTKTDLNANRIGDDGRRAMLESEFLTSEVKERVERFQDSDD